MRLAQPHSELETYWRALLDSASAQATKPIAFFDLDEFIFEYDSIALGAENFANTSGRTDGFGGVYEQVKAGQIEIAMGDLLAHGVTEALSGFENIEQYIDWVALRQKVRPGFKHFLSLMNEHGVTSVAISNGVRPITEAILSKHELALPLAANNFTFNGSNIEVHCLSDWTIGVDKGALVRLAAQWGYTVCGGGGDSRNDIGLAKAVSESNGFVLARRGLGLAAWCNQNLAGGYQEFDDFCEIEDYAIATLRQNNLI